MRRPTSLLTLVFATVLALAGCDTGDDAAGPEPTATGTASPSPTADPSPISPAPTLDPSPRTGEGVPDLAGTCTLDPPAGEADTVRLAHPDGWRVGDGCNWFDPEAESVAEATEPDVAVSWRVADAPYEEVADVRDEVRDPIRYVGARSAYQAVRIEGEATGQGARPEGEPVLLWLVDLDPGTDDQGGVLIGSASQSDGASFDLAARALDRMADTVLIEPAASDRFVVTRLEGGASPWTVTWTWEDRCFRLRAGAPDGEVADEACGVEDPDELSPVLLELEDGLPVLAGLAGPLAHRVTVPAASTLSGGITSPVEGGTLFALPVREPPFELTALDIDGEVVASAEVSG